LAVQHCRAFTLIEIAIAVFILLLVVLLAVPSVNGVLADRRLHRSFDSMNDLVRQAQERSVKERRPYLIEWREQAVILRPESFREKESESPVASLPQYKANLFQLHLPVALAKDPPAQWIFWPSGTCEPATINFKGVDGHWTANYSALTACPELASYAAK
jgi:type II secretory pathway pseudopilin PulG